MTDFALNRNLRLREEFSQEEVEDVFETDFGYQFKGITYRRPDQEKYVILLANKGAIYEDKFGAGDEFTYTGEGVPEKGDQIKTPANKALLDAATDLIPIYLFTSEDGVDEYQYRGLVSVEDHEYISDGQRMIYRFHMERLGISSWEEYQQEKQTIQQISDEEPALTEETTEYIESRRRARSVAFARRVKEQYNYTCAVCGARRFSPQGNPEVEAAHIYPKSEDGVDDLRNGIALCRFHHWVLDSGWIGFTDKREILIRDGSEDELPEEIRALEGEKLRKPKDTSKSPHLRFLTAHRDLHSLEQED